MFRLVCPQCAKSLRFPDSRAGKPTWCPACYAPITLDAPAMRSRRWTKAARVWPAFLLLLGLSAGVGILKVPEQLGLTPALALPAASPAEGVVAVSVAPAEAPVPAPVRWVRCPCCGKLVPASPREEHLPTEPTPPDVQPQWPGGNNSAPSSSPGLDQAQAPREAAAGPGGGPGQGGGGWGNGSEAGEYGNGQGQGQGKKH